MVTGLHLAAGTLESDGHPVLVTPQVAGWTHAGLRVLRLDPGVPCEIQLGAFEAFVLPLSGHCIVDAGEQTFHLNGRQSVFTRVTDFAYVGRDTDVTLTSDAGAEIALPLALAGVRRASAYIAAEQVRVEVRGSGPATRQVNNFGVPGAFDGADRLMSCEVITPGGNWSSYPPHKHDATCPVANEEIYYFRIAGRDGIATSRQGFGVHHTYDDEIDMTVEVRDGDVCLVPRGYHGPSIAAPGYDMYYLNVLAGAGPERSMAFCDDPDHAWIRESWAGIPPDPRCPLTSATGRVAGT